MTCAILAVIMGLCVFGILVLLWHHYEKHYELEGCERCFQPEDVCVCCMTQRPVLERCSHEMYVCILGLVCLVCWWQLYTRCS